MDEVEERGGRIMKDRESRLLLAENSKIIFVLPEQSEKPLKVLKKKEQLKIATRSTSNKLLLRVKISGGGAHKGSLGRGVPSRPSNPNPV